MEIQHEINDRAFQSRSHSLIYRKSGSGDFSRPFKIQDIQILTDIPMGLFFKVKRSWLAPFAQFHIVAVIRAHLHIFIRSVGDIEQRIAQFFFHRADFGIQGFNLFGQLLQFLHQFTWIFTGFFHLGDFFGGGTLLVFHFLYFRKGCSSLFVQLQDTVNSEIPLSSGFHCFFYVFKIFSYAFDI